MNNDIENFKKRLIYRSQYRGTKEMDRLVGSFVKKHIDEFSENDLKELEIFLNNDDEKLYKIYKNELNVIDNQKSKIISLFKNYKL